jgi:hypothetical protein
MKTTKAAKAERRDRRAGDRARKHRKRRDDLRLVPIGGSMDPALIDAILDGARSIDFDAPFVDLAPRILPVVKRVWHPYPPEMELVQVTLPPGIPIGFCIDMGPAFTHITRQLVDTWDVDVPTLLTTSLDNLRALTRVEPPVIQRFTHEGVDVVAIQGQGWGSALLLVPDILGPIVGDLPRLLMTPVRNAVISLPDDVDAETAKLLWWAMTDGAHDVLDVDPVLWTGSDIVSIWEEQPSGLPN